VRTHLAAGHQRWGIFKLRRGRGFGIYFGELQLNWEGNQAEEWLKHSNWLLLSSRNSPGANTLSPRGKRGCWDERDLPA
jgi:hypothetical protein